MASSSPRSGKPVKPSPVTIKRVLKAAIAGGLDVGGFDALPDGTIRVFRAGAMPEPDENLFDQLDAAGKL